MCRGHYFAVARLFHFDVVLCRMFSAWCFLVANVFSFGSVFVKLLFIIISGKLIADLSVRKYNNLQSSNKGNKCFLFCLYSD